MTTNAGGSSEDGTAIPGSGSIVPPNVVTVSNAATIHQNIIVQHKQRDPSFIVRAVWYVFIGWWLTGIAIFVAWLCALSIVLIPVSFVIINKLPVLLTLRPRTRETTVSTAEDGSILITMGGASQLPLWQRALWFVCVGWWACLFAMLAAYALSLTIIGLPAGLMIFNRIPAVMTLQRN